MGSHDIMVNKNATHRHTNWCIMSLRSFMESFSSNIQISAESMASKGSYLANAGAFTVGAFTLNEILMAIATIFGVATFFVNWHFQRKRNEREHLREQREEELHQIRIRTAQGGN